jgi:hypothetical protein
MKKLVPLLTIIAILFCFSACSSVDGDARKAAELSRESLDEVKAQDLQKAEELYKESQDIIARYKGTDQYEEFFAAYNKYLSGESSND